MRGVAPRAIGALSKSRAVLGKILAPPNEGGEEPPSSGWRGRLGAKAPLILLALAMALAVLLNFNRERYYAPLEWDTAKNLAIAENLSPAHKFRLFLRLTPGEDGELHYATYSRFPIGAHALIKLAMLPFGDDLAAKIFAARVLMLVFFGGAAFLAYHSILRISSNRWIALIATLTPFSSYYFLRYSSWVSNEFTPDLFAAMLTFHGMVIFAQEGRFRQLVVKTCVAILLGWHVYAFLAPFILFGLGGEIISAVKSRRGGVSSPNQANALRALSHTLARSRYLRLGVASVAFGAAVLTFNLVNEYDALNGERPLTDLPTVRSFTGRAGLRPGPGFPWGDFIHAQFSRVGGASFPQALINWPGVEVEMPPADSPSRFVAVAPPLPLVALGVLTTAASLAGLLFVRRWKMLFATLALSGFFWALPFRVNTFFWIHQHEAIFYVGVPLTLVTSLLLAAARLGAGRILPVVGIAAFAVFALSAVQMTAPTPEAARVAERQESVFSDLTRIRQVTQGKSVVIAQSEDGRRALYGDSNALDFHLSGSHILYSKSGAPPKRDVAYDFVLIPHRDESFPLLTPHNETVFLYGRADPAALRRSWVDSVASGASGEPAARSVYDVSVGNGALLYVKEPCEAADLEREFFLHVFPKDPDDLPERRGESGFDNRDFAFLQWGVLHDGRCAARVPLPAFAVSGIRTGQFGAGDGEQWRVEFPFDREALRAAAVAAASSEPDARAEFDLRLDEAARTLTYVKEPCAAADTERPFFLHVAPERADDLPEGRRGLGFDSRGFDFALNGVVFDGKCVAQVALPEYRIAGVRTGQWVRGEGETWEATIPFGG